ncbi:hypothetical protein AB0B89_32770 [Sphaerisporangium sp. NPDC049002]|uniref:hypothetical protein n=1 Tax=unclassified Sphaerisporangium TaxID=2630420 RepID=UPI0033CE874F
MDLVGFNTGLAGVLAFLTRLRHGGPRLWLPESLTSFAPAGRPGTDGPATPGLVPLAR